jgi:hypothetical protein
MTFEIGEFMKKSNIWVLSLRKNISHATFILSYISRWCTKNFKPNTLWIALFCRQFLNIEFLSQIYQSVGWVSNSSTKTRSHKVSFCVASLGLAIFTASVLQIRPVQAQVPQPQRPVQPRATAPQAPAPVPATFHTMLSAWLTENRALQSDEAFLRDWMRMSRCEAWRRVANDEFRAAPFAQQAISELRAMQVVRPERLEIRLRAELGRYDAARQEFPLVALEPGQVLPVFATQLAVPEAGPDSVLLAPCNPLSRRFPSEFRLSVLNPELTNGLPMRSAEAERFAAGRTTIYGTRNNSVAVRIGLQIVGFVQDEPRESLRSQGPAVRVDVRIIDMVVEMLERPEVIYRLTDERRRVLDAAAQARRAAAEATALQDAAEREAMARIPNASPLSVRQQFAALDPARGAVLDQANRLAMGRPQGLIGGGTEPTLLSINLNPETIYRISGSTDDVPGIAFVNADRWLRPVLTSEQANAMRQSVNHAYSVIYVPVGVNSDRWRRGPALIAHITKVEVSGVRSDGRPMRFTLDADQPPRPFAMPFDRRGAEAFDIATLRVGLGVGDVLARIEAEYGQKLPYDPTSMTINANSCNLDGPSGMRAGQTCAAAKFALPGRQPGQGGPDTARQARLVQLIVRQVVPGNQRQAVLQALETKYGRPELERTSSVPLARFDLATGGLTQAVHATWGARISDDAGREPVPPYPLSLTMHNDGDLLIVKLVLTDPAGVATQATVQPAAPAPTIRF